MSKFFNRRKRKNKVVYEYFYLPSWPNKPKIVYHTIYDQKSINDILFNTTLKQVIGDYVVLKKKGSLYVGRCPFCKTFTKNDYHFVISDKRHRYKCFECGVGGVHAVSFLMRYYDIPFSKALVYINSFYHKNKFELKGTENKIVPKGIDVTGEDNPFF